MRLSVLAALILSTAGVSLASAQPPPAIKLQFPVACEVGRTCEIQRYLDHQAGPGLLDYRCGRRTGEAHNGVDIRLLDMAAQRRGVAVLAAAPGKVFRIREGVDDVAVTAATAAAVNDIGLGNAVVIDHGGGWRTAYGHMAKGSVMVKAGDTVVAGQPIGRIGLSGLTEFPHLHFIVQRGDKPVDPFAPAGVTPGACPAQASLWTPDVARRLTYKAGVILNVGLAGEAPTMPGVEAGRLAAVTATAPVIAAYGRALQLDKGDVIETTLTGPGGVVLATSRLAPLDNDKAQYFYMVGKRRPATGWPKGAYIADFKVHRGGRVALQRRATITL